MSITENVPPGLLDKLNKLKNLADGAAAVGSHEESANAAARFQELLLKYNLSEQQVSEHSIENKVKMVRDDFDLEEYRLINSTTWIRNLVRTLADHCMCRMIINYNGTKVHVLGEQYNVGMVFYFAEQLAAKINAAMTIAWSMYDGEENRGAYCRGFINGAVVAIRSKLYKERERMFKQTENKGMELMVISKEALAKQFCDQLFPPSSLVSSRGASLTNGKSNDGFSSGHKAGGGMNINKGLSPRGGTKQLGNG